jgi:hypothetical protein
VPCGLLDGRPRAEHDGVIPDAHCHLDQLADADRAVDEAAAAGVGPILAVSMDADAAERILDLRDAPPGAGPRGRRSAPEPHRRDHAPTRRSGSFAARGSARRRGPRGRDRARLQGRDDRGPQARQRDALAVSWTGPRAAASREPALAPRGPRGHGRRDRVLARGRARSVLHWFTHSAKLARHAREHGVFISPGLPSSSIPRRARSRPRSTLDPARRDGRSRRLRRGGRRAAGPGRAACSSASRRPDAFRSPISKRGFSNWRAISRAIVRAGGF